MANKYNLIKDCIMEEIVFDNNFDEHEKLIKKLKISMILSKAQIDKNWMKSITRRLQKQYKISGCIYIN